MKAFDALHPYEATTSQVPEYLGSRQLRWRFMIYCLCPPRPTSDGNGCE